MLKDELSKNFNQVEEYLARSSCMGTVQLDHELNIQDCNIGFIRMFCPGHKPVGKPISDYIDLEGCELRSGQEYRLPCGRKTGIDGVIDCYLIGTDGGYILFCEKLLLTESSALEQIGSVNNELINLQRELVKNNNLLEKLSKELDERLTQRTADTEKLRNRQRLIFDLMPVGVCFLKNRTVELANQACYKIFGYEAREIVGMNTAAFYKSDSDYQRFGSEGYEAIAKALTYTTEAEMKRKDGSLIWCSLIGRAVNAENIEEGVIVMIQDISQRKLAELELCNSEEKYHTLFNEMLDGFALHEIICDDAGKPCNYSFIAVNPAFVRLTGLDPENLSGRTILDIMPDIEPFWIETYGKVALTGEPVLFENYNKVLDKHFEVKAFRSAPKQFVTLFSDITERKKALQEKFELEAQLFQAQKMESVGRLAGGVAHDFNNMLGVILGHADLALMEMEPSQPIYADLEEIRNAAVRSAELTRQLLAFARKQTVLPKVLDLNDTIGGMIKMLQRLLGEHIQLNWQPEANLWPVKVDPSQIDQILANLCVNARDSIVDTGNITIETRMVSVNNSDISQHADFDPGDYVCFSVSDDGCGMDRETQAHIFEPFFTTKAVGEGTGLGLATVYGAVKQNNGYINVYSEPGNGTIFTVYLPRHLCSMEYDQLQPIQEQALNGEETILLVEDESSILRMTTKMLEIKGYTVLSADSAEAAKSLAAAYHDQFRLLIVDVIMPNINGRELAQQILSLNPKVKVLYMSGYTADVIAKRGILEQGVAFIQKPFSINELAQKVREVLAN
jgi:PAS domain S-box-containing protein